MCSADIKKPIVKVFTRIDSIVEKQGRVKQGRTIICHVTLDFHDAVCYDFYDALRREDRCTEKEKAMNYMSSELVKEWI